MAYEFKVTMVVSDPDPKKFPFEVPPASTLNMNNIDLFVVEGLVADCPKTVAFGEGVEKSAGTYRATFTCTATGKATTGDVSQDLILTGKLNNRIWLPYSYYKKTPLKYIGIDKSSSDSGGGNDSSQDPTGTPEPSYTYPDEPTYPPEPSYAHEPTSAPAPSH
ncbi:MAG: hypothetical protein HQ526_06230 [Actinobacteria bacterium]|nr:hypothetical protein [Actinomycetota bacterium]